MTSKTTQPWLFYSYPWMPYPRRIQLYLREKQIPSTSVIIVRVTDPQNGNRVVDSQAETYPPRPEGSPPILAIPTDQEDSPWIFVRQSMATINFLETVTSPGGQLVDVQTRDLYPNLRQFYQAFSGRKSAKREEESGELAGEDVIEKMRFWHDGVWRAVR